MTALQRSPFPDRTAGKRFRTAGRCAEVLGRFTWHLSRQSRSDRHNIVGYGFGISISENGKPTGTSLWIMDWDGKKADSQSASGFEATTFGCALAMGRLFDSETQAIPGIARRREQDAGMVRHRLFFLLTSVTRVPVTGYELIFTSEDFCGIVRATRRTEFNDYD